MEGQMSIFEFPECLPEGKDKRKAEIIKKNDGDIISPAQQYYINTGRTDYWQRDIIFEKGQPVDRCKHSGHSCNKEELWKVANTLDGISCKKTCCRQCSIKGCGARCNGSEEPKHDPQLDIAKVPIYHCSLTSVWNECPNCKIQPSNIGNSKQSRFSDDYYVEQNERCPHCGQKLLWDWELIDQKAHKSAELRKIEQLKEQRDETM